MSIGLYIDLAPLYLKYAEKLQEKRFDFIKSLASIIPENVVKVSKIKCFKPNQQTLITKQLITNILLMYMDECRKALAEGERIEISKVGSIIPEVKVYEGNFNLPMCNKDGGNPPYTKLKITRNNLLSDTMNNALIKNIENGIYGLDKLPFSRQQMDILKKSGYIPADAEIKNGDDE